MLGGWIGYARSRGLLARVFRVCEELTEPIHSHCSTRSATASSTKYKKGPRILPAVRRFTAAVPFAALVNDHRDARDCPYAGNSVDNSIELLSGRHLDFDEIRSGR